MVGDFNVGGPPKFLACLKEISAGLWVDLEAAWAGDKQPAVTGQRTWGSTGGNRRDLVEGCVLADAAVRSCVVDQNRWVQPHLAVRSYFDSQR